VRFVNDSKATNADAARQAMTAIPRFYWIAGGLPKSGGIEPLKDLFPKVAKAYLIGEAAPEFARTLKGQAEAELCGELSRAVAAAYRDAAASGDEAVVLLSPACASFDQFPDFEVRGDAFRRLVGELATAPAREAAG
jgi:UDP-N-acetylmuramoylalanine--D-glutamate ligase